MGMIGEWWHSSQNAHISTHTEKETKTKTDGCKHEKPVLYEAQSELQQNNKWEANISAPSSSVLVSSFRGS